MHFRGLDYIWADFLTGKTSFRILQCAIYTVLALWSGCSHISFNLVWLEWVYSVKGFTCSEKLTRTHDPALHFPSVLQSILASFTSDEPKHCSMNCHHHHPLGHFKCIYVRVAGNAALYISLVISSHGWNLNSHQDINIYMMGADSSQSYQSSHGANFLLTASKNEMIHVSVKDLFSRWQYNFTFWRT